MPLLIEIAPPVPDIFSLKVQLAIVGLVPRIYIPPPYLATLFFKSLLPLPPVIVKPSMRVSSDAAIFVPLLTTIVPSSFCEKHITTDAEVTVVMVAPLSIVAFFAMSRDSRAVSVPANPP